MEGEAPCSLYFAYGSNLSRRRMEYRCPSAIALGSFILRDSKLVFRGVADCAYEAGSICHGALWKITPACERHLDTFEGVIGGHYRKEYVPLDDPAKYDDTHLMLYVKNSTGIFPPAREYVEIISQGYRDFGLPLDVLLAAVRHSHDARSPSQSEFDRYRRNGQPQLASRPNADGTFSPAKPVVWRSPERPPYPRISDEANRENKKKYKRAQKRYAEASGDLFDDGFDMPPHDEDDFDQRWRSPLE